MKSLVRVASVAALATLVAGPAAAQQPPPSPAQQPPPSSQQPSPAQSPAPAWGQSQGQQTSAGVTVPSDTLIGTKVRDAQGKEVGEISRLMIDARQGKIAAAVIKQGGTLGMGAKEISVPWEGLTLQRGQNQELVVTMQQQYLEQAPSASPSSGQPRQQEPRRQ